MSSDQPCFVTPSQAARFMRTLRQEGAEMRALNNVTLNLLRIGRVNEATIIMQSINKNLRLDVLSRSKGPGDTFQGFAQSIMLAALMLQTPTGDGDILGSDLRNALVDLGIPQIPFFDKSLLPSDSTNIELANNYMRLTEGEPISVVPANTPPEYRL